MTLTAKLILVILAVVAFIVAAAIIAPDWDAALFWISLGLALFAAATVVP